MNTRKPLHVASIVSIISPFKRPEEGKWIECKIIHKVTLLLDNTIVNLMKVS